MYCVVKNCRSFWTPNSNIKFHSFPKDKEKRQIWLSIIPLKGSFYKSAKICSLHFKPNDYEAKRIGRLLNSAIPFYSLQSCDCVLTETEACNCRIEPSTSAAQPNIGAVSLYMDTTCTEILHHESKSNFLFTALTSPKTTLLHQVPQPGFLQSNIKVHCENEPPAKRLCLKDFNVQVKIKSPKELSLEKKIKILRQKVTRQQQKINNMEAIISIVRNDTRQSKIANTLQGNVATICKTFNYKPKSKGTSYSEEPFRSAIPDAIKTETAHDRDVLYSQMPTTIRKNLATNSDMDSLKSKQAVKFLLDGTLRFRVCRYCLKMTQNLSELDEIIVVAGKCGLYEVSIKDIMASFYPVKVTYDLNIPNKICKDCLERALQCYLFTQQCEQAERALRNCFEEINEKFSKLDPIEPLKRRGKPKLYLNHNKLNIEFENVIDYAEPLINLINLNGLSSNSQSDDLECPKCWQVLPNLTSLVNHEKSHPKSMWCHCKQCGKSFVKYTQLKKHKRQEHSEIVEEIKPEKNFTCKQCGVTNKLLSKHLLHIAKYCFTQTLSNLIMNPKNNCAICFNKSNDMVNLNEIMYMHGGSAGLMGEKSISNMAATVFPDIAIHYPENKICKHCLNKLITSYIFILNVRNHRIRVDKCVSTMIETLKNVDENQHVLIEFCENVRIPLLNEDTDLEDGAEEFLEDEFSIPKLDSESDAISTHSSSTDDI